MNKLDKFTIVTGSIGLAGDTITILGFATGAGLVIPNVKGFNQTPDGLILLTGLAGLYSLTMIVWFLLRRKHLNPETATFGFDELALKKTEYDGYSFFKKIEKPEDSVWELVFNTFPFVGAFPHILAHKSARVIFWIAVFISLFPTIFWLYLISSQAFSAAIFGIFISFLLSQYSTFFALALDKFVRSIYVDFSA